MAFVKSLNFFSQGSSLLCKIQKSETVEVELKCSQERIGYEFGLLISEMILVVPHSYVSNQQPWLECSAQKTLPQKVP